MNWAAGAGQQEEEIEVTLVTTMTSAGRSKTAGPPLYLNAAHRTNALFNFGVNREKNDTFRVKMADTQADVPTPTRK